MLADFNDYCTATLRGKRLKKLEQSIGRTISPQVCYHITSRNVNVQLQCNTASDGQKLISFKLLKIIS